MNTFLIFCCMAIPQATMHTTEEKPLLAVSHHFTVKTMDSASFASYAVELSKEMGGYFTVLSNTSVTLKIPSEHTQKTCDALKQKSTVLEQNTSSHDIRQEMFQQKTHLQSRKDSLQRYLVALQKASPSAVASLEQEMVGLIEDIESIQNTIHSLEHSVDFSNITLSFQSTHRLPPINNGSSSFEWINSVDAAKLFSSFQGEHL
jgi:hypothetical protein